MEKRIIDSLRNDYPQFLLANHSFSHGFNDKYSKFYATTNTDSALNDFLRNEKDLKVPVKIIRLPGNNTWASNGVINGQKADNPLIVNWINWDTRLLAGIWNGGKWVNKKLQKNQQTKWLKS